MISLVFLTKCSRTKSALSTDINFYIRELKIFNKITNRSKHFTYIQYLTTILFIIIPPSNPKTPDKTPLTTKNGQSNKPADWFIKDPPTYDRQIAHDVEINLSMIVMSFPSPSSLVDLTQITL